MSSIKHSYNCMYNYTYSCMYTQILIPHKCNNVLSSKSPHRLVVNRKSSRTLAALAYLSNKPLS